MQRCCRMVAATRGFEIDGDEVPDHAGQPVVCAGAPVDEEGFSGVKIPHRTTATVRDESDEVRDRADADRAQGGVGAVAVVGDMPSVFVWVMTAIRRPSLEIVTAGISVPGPGKRTTGLKYRSTTPTVAVVAATIGARSTSSSDEAASVVSTNITSPPAVWATPPMVRSGNPSGRV